MTSVNDYAKYRTGEHILVDGHAHTYKLPATATRQGNILGFTQIARMPLSRGLEAKLTFERGPLNFDILSTTFDQDVELQTQNPATYDAFRYLVRTSQKFGSLIAIAYSEHDALMKEYFSNNKSINCKALGSAIFALARQEEALNKPHILSFARLDNTNYVTISNLTQAGFERYNRLASQKQSAA